VTTTTTASPTASSIVLFDVAASRQHRESAFPHSRRPGAVLVPNASRLLCPRPLSPLVPLDEFFGNDTAHSPLSFPLDEVFSSDR
jgi:hypothetical protein